MKKVLIITTLFNSSSRVPGLAEYLSKFGWEATVLTASKDKVSPVHLTFSPGPSFNKFKIIEISYSGDAFYFWRKIFKLFGFKSDRSILNQVKDKAGATSPKSLIDYIFKFYQVIFAYPDEEKKWKKPAVKIGIKLLENEQFNAIISSSSPVTSHIIAGELKKKFNLPWIADLRDLWSQNHNYSYPSCRKFFDRRLEKKTLSLADALTTVSEPLAEKLKELHKNKNVYTIKNGFYPEELNISKAPLTKKFTITYAGTLYAGKQDPKDLFIALNELVSEKKIRLDDVEIRFYTGELPWLKKEIKEYNLENTAYVYEKVSRREIIKRQSESQVLLIIYWGEKKEKGWQSLKIFGYLAALRPILVTNGASGDVVERMIEETKSGAYCRNIAEIKDNLEKYYFDYKKTGEVSYHGDIEMVKKHSYDKKAEELANILNRLMR